MVEDHLSEDEDEAELHELNEKAYREWTALKNKLKAKIKELEKPIRSQLDQIAAIKARFYAGDLNRCTSCDKLLEGYGGSGMSLEDYCRCKLPEYPKE